MDNCYAEYYVGLSLTIGFVNDSVIDRRVKRFVKCVTMISFLGSLSLLVLSVVSYR